MKARIRTTCPKAATILASSNSKIDRKTTRNSSSSKHNASLRPGRDHLPGKIVKINRRIKRKAPAKAVRVEPAHFHPVVRLRRQSGKPGYNALNATTALWPPKPRLLLSATRVLCVRLTLGT